MAALDIEILLDAIRQKESGGNRFAVSPKGAKGPYQFMPETAAEFGLTDPFNEEQSREAAKRKMLGLLNEFGRPDLAIAAYNLGQGNLRKNDLDYNRIPETRDYVKDIMGMLGKPVQTADSGQIMSDAPQQATEQPMPNYDMTGILDTYNAAKSRQPQRQSLVQPEPTGFSDPKTMGLLALGLQMMGDSRGRSFGEALAGGGMAGLNTMAGIQQNNLEAQQAEQERQQAMMQQQAEQEQAIQQQAQQEALSQVPAEVMQDPKQLANLMMKLGMHKEALEMLQNINKPSMGSKKQIIPLEDGSYGVFDPVSGEIQPVDQRSPIYSPTSQYNLQQAKGYGGIAPAIQEARGKADIDTAKEVQQAQQLLPLKMQETQGKANININEAAEKIKAESKAKAQIDLPKIQANADYTKNLIDEISAHPGLSSVVGVPNPLTAWTPGTDAAGFRSKLEQLGGKNFLEAFESLKGGGQITEIEGQKATAAIAALSTAQSEEDFKKELSKLKEVIDIGYSRAMQKAQQTGGAPSNKNKPTISNW